MKQHLTYHPLTIITMALLLGLFLAPVGHPAAAGNARLQGSPQSGISQPQSGDTVSGIVVVEGTAVHGSFLRYELAFNNGGDWIVFAEGDQQVVEGTLAVWDTTVGQPAAPVFPDGTYRLRLRVVRQDSNYDEYFVRNLQVLNAVTPTPSPTATPELEGTPTPAGEATATPATRPALLPSLTPFPTPSPIATAANLILPGEGSGGQPGGQTETDEGLFQRLLALDIGPVATAFWQGTRLALLPFVALAAYLLLRAGIRRLWRTFWGRWQERGGP